MVVGIFKQDMAAERWVQTLRDSVADAGFADGWSVLNRNGKVQVQHYGTNARESELIAAAERVLAGVAS